MAKSNGSVLVEHFKIGNIIKSDYWRTYDLVLDFTATGVNQGWYVTVIMCDVNGKPIDGERNRTHCTFPDKRDIVVANIN